MKFEIWAEGYRTSGESSGAMLLGTPDGASFKEACDSMFGGERAYDSDRGTLWGCRLFDNEADARKLFG